MNLSEIQENWTTIILLPLIIGVAANVLTPSFIKLWKSGFASVGLTLKILGKKTALTRIEQIERDRLFIQSFIDEPLKFAVYLGQQFCRQIFILWTFVIAYGVFIFLIIRNGGDVDFFIARILGAMIGAGGAQTFIGFFVLIKDVEKITNPEKFFTSLETELQRLRLYIEKYHG